MHDIAMSHYRVKRALWEASMNGDGVERAYASIVAEVSTLARKLAGEDPYKSANGPDALMYFTDQLDGVVAAIGIDKAQIVRFSVRDKITRQEHT